MTSSTQRMRRIQKMKRWEHLEQQLDKEKTYMPAMPPYILISDLCNIIRKRRKAIRKHVKRFSQLKA